MPAGEATEHRNEVLLVGRLAAPADELELPSGDVLTRWRLVVERNARAPAGRVGVDTLDCSSLSAAARRSASSWQPGDLVEVVGSLRRRFWRAPAGVASRCEVAVTRARRLRRAG